MSTSKVKPSIAVVPEVKPTNQIKPLVLTRQQVADLLQVTPSQVYELTRKRSSRPLPFVRVGKFLRFRLADVEAYVNGVAA